MAPLSLTLKNPEPLIAISSGLLVTVRLPCVKLGRIAPTLAPMPTLVEPLPDRELANTSLNWMLDPLNPTVLELEMLLPMTSKYFVAASSPLKPC